MTFISRDRRSVNNPESSLCIEIYNLDSQSIELGGTCEIRVHSGGTVASPRALRATGERRASSGSVLPVRLLRFLGSLARRPNTRTDGWTGLTSNWLTDRGVVGVQVLRGHELRHQGALADRRGTQHEDAIRRWTLRRAALPRARQRARRRIPCRSWIRGGQVLRAAPNRRETRRVWRLATTYRRDLYRSGRISLWERGRSRSAESESSSDEARVSVACVTGASNGFR